MEPQTVDLGGMIVGYNFVIGVLLMLSSEKIGAYAGHVNKSYGDKIARYTKVSTLAFGTTVAVLSLTVYVVFHMLRIMV